MTHSFEYNEKRIITYLSNAMNESERLSFEAEVQKDKELADLYDEISIQRYFSLQNEYEHFLLYEDEEETFEGEEEMDFFERRMEANKELAAKYEFAKSLQKALDERYKKEESARINANIDAIIYKKATHSPQSSFETSSKPTQTNYKPYLLLLFIFILPLMYYIIFYKPSHGNEIRNNISQMDTHANKIAKVDSQIGAKVNEGAKENLQMVTKANEKQEIKTNNILINHNDSKRKQDSISHINEIKNIRKTYTDILIEIDAVCELNEQVKKCDELIKSQGGAEPNNELIKNCKVIYAQYEYEKKEWERNILEKKKVSNKELLNRLTEYLSSVKQTKQDVKEAFEYLQKKTGKKC